ncbi:MAG TPA: hypothetical protein VK427_20975, partial [Kofleriaceae bacterium]|nr:hypothetical protein [Kofleriaceae bacterium]
MRRALVLLLIAAGGCGGSKDNPQRDASPPPPPPDVAIDAAIAPVFRNAVTLSDADLAQQALQIMGAPVPGAQAASCNTCHGLTRQNLRYWRSLSDTSMARCFTDLDVASAESARAMIDCMRAMPMATADFATKKLGIYSTAANLPWFQYVFWKAYGDAGPAKLAELQAMAGMPKGLTPMTQGQFDILAEWYVRGLPMLDQTLPADPAPTVCTPNISSEVAPHVTAMKTTGWRAVNTANQMAMHGCGTATDPKLCLATVPLASAQPYGVGWDVPGQGRLRVLADVDYRSSYWTRSSPDGRFVGHGVQNVAGSYILDLQRDAL